MLDNGIEHRAGQEDGKEDSDHKRGNLEENSLRGTWWSRFLDVNNRGCSEETQYFEDSSQAEERQEAEVRIGDEEIDNRQQGGQIHNALERDDVIYLGVSIHHVKEVINAEDDKGEHIHADGKPQEARIVFSTEVGLHDIHNA